VLCVVASAEELFQPDVQANKQIAAPHFLYFEFGFACSSVAPGNRNDRPGVTANDRFEGNFHREIEMGRNEGAAPVDHRFSVRFESVGRIVQTDVEKELQEFVSQAVQEKLCPRIIDCPAPFNESASENAVPTIIEFFPIVYDVPAIVRFVGHHNDGCVPMHLLKAILHCPSETVFSVVLNWRKCRDSALQVLQDSPGPVPASVVYHDNFVGHAAKTQLDDQMFDG